MSNLPSYHQPWYLHAWKSCGSPSNTARNIVQQQFLLGLGRLPRKSDFYLAVGPKNVVLQAAFAARSARMLRRSEVHGRESCNLTLPLRGCREAVCLASPIAEGPPAAQASPTIAGRMLQLHHHRASAMRRTLKSRR